LIKKFSIVIIIILAISALTACASNEDVTVIELTDEELEDLKENLNEATDEDNVNAPVKPLPPLDEERPLPKETRMETGEGISIGVLRGPNGMGMSYLMEENSLDLYETAYQINILAATDRLATRLAKGELDFATLPTTVAANVYQETNGRIQLLGINTFGGLYLVENGTSIQSFTDLKNVGLSISNRPETGPYILDYLLEANAIKDKNKPEVNYIADNQKLSADLVSNEGDLAILPEPFVSTLLQRNKKLRVALDLAEEWQDVSRDSILPMGCLVVNTEFASENPESVATFIQRYKRSIEYVNSNQEEAGLLIEKHKLMNNSRQAINSIDRSQLTWIDAGEAQEDVVKYLEILLEVDKNIIGGEVPDEKFFYQDTRKTKNPFEGMIILGAWLGVWTLMASRISAFYLPSPMETGKTLLALLSVGETYIIIWHSLVRVLIGLFLAIILGVSTGLLAGVFDNVYKFLQPVLVAIKSTPVVSFIILAIIYMKSDYVPSFCGMLLCYPIIYYNVIEGYRTVDAQLISMSLVYNVPLKRQLLKLYLPSMAPYIFAGILTSIGIGWKGTIAAEVISVLQSSIGNEIYNGKIYLDTPSVFAWTIIIIISSLIIEKSTRKLISRNSYYERFKVI